MDGRICVFRVSARQGLNIEYGTQANAHWTTGGKHQRLATCNSTLSPTCTTVSRRLWPRRPTTVRSTHNNVKTAPMDGGGNIWEGQGSSSAELLCGMTGRRVAASQTVT